MENLPTTLLTEPPSREQKDDSDVANAKFFTVVLEEGRHITHPDFLVGPLELFAETTLDLQLGGEPRGHSSCYAGDVGHRQPGCRVLRRSNMSVPGSCGGRWIRYCFRP